MSNFKEKLKKENIKAGFKWFFKSFIWLGVLLLVIDIVSKHIALNSFGGWELFYKEELNIQPAPFIPGFINFTLTFNTGAGFGIFKDLDDLPRRIILIGISVIMSAAFLGIYIKKFKKLNGWYKAIFMCLASGAIGNLIDRACYPDGKVIDFIEFGFMNFPVFNFADAVLVVSIAIMIIYMIYEEVSAYIKKRKNAAEPKDSSEKTEKSNEKSDETVDEKSDSKKQENTIKEQENTIKKDDNKNE